MCVVFSGKNVIDSSLGTKKVCKKKNISLVRGTHEEMSPSTEPRDAKTMTLGTDLSIRTSLMNVRFLYYDHTCNNIFAGTNNVIATSLTTMHFSLK